MTYTSSIADPLGSISHKFVQIPIALLRKIRSFKLTGTQHDLWLLLCEFDPFGDRWIDVPPPSELATLLGVDARTVERAARRLQDLGLFDFQIKNWKVKNSKGSKSLGDFSTDNGIDLSDFRQIDPKSDKSIQNPTKRSKIGSKDPNDSLKPSPSKASDHSHTTTDNTDNSKQQTESPPSHPVLEGQERIADLGKTLQEMGFQLNKTIATTIEQCFESKGSGAAAVVRDAATAVLEQNHNARNRGGMLVSAIRNEWKPGGNGGVKEIAGDRGDRYEFAQASPPTDLSDVLIEIDIECERLGWSRENAISHMVDRHRWRPMAFKNLGDSDLYDLLDVLKEK
jgi:hypothetical protein